MLNLNKPRHPRSSLLSIGDDPYLGVDTPSPADFGLPEKYTQWRRWQYGIVERILDSPKRFFGLCSPTGSGKSLLGIASAVMSCKRAVLLTSTLGLQNQISSDFETIATDIRGMSNYKCVAAAPLGLPDHTTVSEAPCQMGYRCSLRFGGGCDYFDRYRAAQKAGVVVTNYQCWAYDQLKQEGSLHISRAAYNAAKELGTLGTDPRIPVDMLIADEADLAEGELARHISVDVSRREVLHLGLEWLDAGLTIEDWKQWAADNQAAVERRLGSIEKRLAAGGGGGNGNGSTGGDKGWSKDLKSLRDMNRKLQRLAGMRTEDEWVMQEVDGDSDYHKVGAKITNFKSVQFSPLSPARYAESVLWRGVEKIVLMSATVRPKTLELLGIAPDETEFIEFPSTFPVERRPVILVPSVQMNFRNEQDDLKMMWWLGKLDAILKPRIALGRKGVIHAVSYKRMTFIRDNSEFGKYMLTHNTRDRAEVIERFRQAEGACVLVSPSVDTGYDFHGDQCRFMVLAKIPFASTQDKLVKERQARDPEYGLFMAAQTIVQMTGRAMRAETDWSETIALDDNFLWFLPKVRKFLPEWWWQSLVWGDDVPEPIQF